MYQFARLTVRVNVTRPTCNTTARDQMPFCCRQVPFYRGIWSYIKESWDGEIFPVKTGFFSIQVPFKTGFTVFLFITYVAVAWTLQ